MLTILGIMVMIFAMFIGLIVAIVNDTCIEHEIDRMIREEA